MSKSIISACLLSVSSLTWSTHTLAATDPITGVWEGATTAVTNATTTPLELLTPVKHNHMYTITDVNTGASKEVRVLWHGHPIVATETNGCENGVFPGICQGVKYTITDIHTGKQYMVMSVKQGTMDIMHGTKVIRYQYVMPVVKPM